LRTSNAVIAIALFGLVVWALTARRPSPSDPESDRGPAEDVAAGAVEKGADDVTRIEMSDEQWREKLTPEEYRVLREKGTERAFTGEYWKTKAEGVYHCRGCGLALFESDTKFDSGCGWPSFFKPLEGARIEEHEDLAFGMRRTEVTCRRCGGHLGHVFTDGPEPTGLRYCINSVSISLAPGEDGARAESEGDSGGGGGGGGEK
jgi:peptide-methionine (R)-S-oxide reductase